MNTFARPPIAFARRAPSLAFTRIALPAVLAFAGAVAAPLIASQTAHAQVTFERVLHADREPQNWLNYSSTLDNQRYSRLDSITTRNVADLELQWVWQARSLEKFEATPLVVDGILYTVQAPNDVVALDAATGRVFWTYNHENSPAARTCCGRENRGRAIVGDT
jgi:alcohol dehydrogenase (cytochrome c)